MYDVEWKPNPVEPSPLEKPQSLSFHSSLIPKALLGVVLILLLGGMVGLYVLHFQDRDRNVYTHPASITLDHAKIGTLDPIVRFADQTETIQTQLQAATTTDYVDAAIADLAATSYVDSSVSGLASTDYVDASYSTYETKTITTATYTISGTTYRYFAVDTVTIGAAITITLPSAATTYQFTIADSSGAASSYPITINCAGSDTINGGTSITLLANYNSVTLASDGSSKWIVI